MTMEWKTRDYRFDNNGGNSSGSFEKHAEHMREFRKSHANVAMVNVPRCSEAALLGSMRPLQVRCIRMESGGSRILNGTTDWLALVPVLKVARYKLTQN